MKISVFGKSGPRVVTAALVCAGAAVCPDASQPAAASTMKNARRILDMSDLPVSALFSGSLSWRAALSRYLDRPRPRPAVQEPLHRRDKGGYFPAWTMVDAGSSIAANRSNCHVD